MQSANGSWLPVAEVASAIAVALFAFVQLGLTWHSDRTRRRERTEDERRAMREAHAVLHAEWFRMWSTARKWSESSLIDLVEVDRLVADDILPRDWGASSDRIGALGVLSAQLASMSFTKAHDVRDIVLDFALVCRAYHTALRNAPAQAETIKQQHLPRLVEEEARIHAMALEAANVLEDALDNCPVASAAQPIEFRREPESEFGREMKRQLQKSTPSGSGLSAWVRRALLPRTKE